MIYFNLFYAFQKCRFSGISEEDLQNVRTTIRDVQAVLLSRFSDKTILIGHSFDSDLRALRVNKLYYTNRVAWKETCEN